MYSPYPPLDNNADSLGIEDAFQRLRIDDTDSQDENQPRSTTFSPARAFNPTVPDFTPRQQEMSQPPTTALRQNHAFPPRVPLFVPAPVDHRTLQHQIQHPSVLGPGQHLLQAQNGNILTSNGFVPQQNGEADLTPSEQPLSAQGVLHPPPGFQTATSPYPAMQINLNWDVTMPQHSQHLRNDIDRTSLWSPQHTQVTNFTPDVRHGTMPSYVSNLAPFSSPGLTPNYGTVLPTPTNMSGNNRSQGTVQTTSFISQHTESRTRLEDEVSPRHRSGRYGRQDRRSTAAGLDGSPPPYPAAPGPFETSGRTTQGSPRGGQRARGGAPSWTKLDTRTCDVCCDEQRCVTLDCGHHYCKECCTKSFVVTDTDRPKCCGVPVKLSIARYFMTRKQLQRLTAVCSIAIEDRIYCPEPSCSAILSLSELKRKAQYSLPMCSECSAWICVNCKQRAHKDMCKESEVVVAMRKEAKDKGWKECPRCSEMIEKRSGCTHITCRCGAEWCFICRAHQTKGVRCLCIPLNERKGYKNGCPCSRDMLMPKLENVDLSCDFCGQYQSKVAFICRGCTFQFCRPCVMERYGQLTASSDSDADSDTSEPAVVMPPRRARRIHRPIVPEQLRATIDGLVGAFNASRG